MYQRQQFLPCSPRSRWVEIRWSLVLALLACAAAISYSAQVAAAAGTITAATNTSPIVITSAAHGLLTGDQVIVSGVMGNTAANGSWTVTRVDDDRFSLNGSTGNGAYTGGGTFTTDLPQTDATLVVNSTNDPGTGGCTTMECTLREAITQANSDGIATTITFDIPGPGPHVIMPANGLPVITEPVTINGLSEPGITSGACPLPSGSLMVQIDGTSAGRSDGLQLGASSSVSTIRGLSITNFGFAGIEIASSNNFVTCSYIGIEADGNDDGSNGNSYGIAIINASSNTLGGAAVREGNVIAHNSRNGVHIANAGSNTVRDNIIRNNGEIGVEVNNSNGTIILENTIRNNGRDGVRLVSGLGNRVTQNKIDSNGTLGIELVLPPGDGATPNDPGDGDGGTNNGQNFPVLSSVTAAGVVNGSLDSLATNTTYPVKIEFFANTTCDSSGHGEGEVYLGSIAIAGPGNFNTTLTLVSGKDFITATATDNNGNTSEFSACQRVAQPPTAIADSYSTNEDTPLNVAAPGVLGNDTDADNDALTAVLVSGPSNGTLTLNADGSFTYTPAANFSGSDSFTYKANDGQADSNVATVTITVVSAASQISHLKAQVQTLITSGALPRSNGQALTNKLDSAQAQLQKGNPNAAITKLQEFITQVNDYIANSILTAAAGQPLIDAANAIITSLSGGASTANVDAVAPTATDQPNRIFLPVVTR